LNEETDKPGMSPEKASQHWQLQLALAEREVKDWHDYGAKIQSRYRADKDSLGKSKRAGKRFAILYSNTETLKSALYARTPKPDVRRRYGDRNPVARTAAEIIERTLGYCADNTGHDRAYRAGVHDVCLPGRGVVWLVYEAKTAQVPAIDPMTQQPAVGMDGKPVLEEQIADQKVTEEHVFWQDFLWEPGRAWRDVQWVARRHKMSRDDLRDNGFENPEDVPLNWSPDVTDKTARDTPDALKRAEVWEIWCKRTTTRYWVVKGHTKALRIDPDPYELEDFWPLAEPLSAVLGTDSYVPTPYFAEYEDQADDLDEMTARISNLIKALKRRGIYDSSIQELKRLATAGDNVFIGVDGAKFNLATKGGTLSNVFAVEDPKPIADVLVGLYEQRDRLVAAIYEVSGISDIIRGSSNPNETATAQNIKAQFGSMRLRDSQREVQRWVRDSYRIKAELICTNFTPERLAEICGMDANDPTFQEAVQVLKSDQRRGYQIDIETDSTVFEDAEAEKNARVEVLGAMGQFAQQWMPVVQLGGPPMLKLVGEMMSHGVRGMKAGRSLEDTIDEAFEAMGQQMAQQAQQPPPPDPAVVKVEAEMKRDEQAHQLDMQGKQMDMEAQQMGLQMDMQAKHMELAHKQQTSVIEVEKAAQMAAFARDAGIRKANESKVGNSSRKQ
jgi:hypothetical protein